MNQKDFMQRVVQFNQTLFDNTFETTQQIQNQYVKMGESMMDQIGPWPAEGRKFYDNCVEAYQAACLNCKSYVDGGYQQAEKLFE